MKKFKVIGWVYTIDFDNQYVPYCRKVERIIKAFDEKVARCKFCSSFGWMGIVNLTSAPL